MSKSDYFNAQLDYYNLMVKRVAEEQDASNQPVIEITFSNNLYGVIPSVDAFIKDAELMNVIRKSNDPSIKDAFQGMLTTMALANGRKAEDVDVIEDDTYSDPSIKPLSRKK